MVKIEEKVYIEDEICNCGHIAKELYVIRLDIPPYPAICLSCLQKILQEGQKLIEQRIKENRER